MSIEQNSLPGQSAVVKQNNIISANTKRRKSRVDWHEAASCALQIELQEYSDFLEYQSEYPLGRGSYRIDLLVIKKLTEESISKNIALIFKTFNLFEIKGVGSSVTIDSYYKTIGYAGLFISQTGKPNRYSRYDISLTFLSCRYPRKLMRHLSLLEKENKISIANPAPGVYHINKETFITQIIVTKELSPDDNLYLHCLTNELRDASLANRLANDYKLHQEQDIYVRYMHQLTTANTNTKGESPMVCEGILNLCGTSSEEIIARAKKESDEYYLPQINKLTSKNNQLSSANNQLSSKIAYLQSLLTQNNIPFDLDNIPDT